MYTTPGIITIRTIRGTRGPFAVGTLICDLGEFVIKDKRLDQFDEGEYEGTFTVSKIATSCYTSKGRMVVELRASLAEFQLETQAPAEGDAGIEVAEPEEEEEAPPPAAPAVPPTETSEPTPKPEPAPDEDEDAHDAELFGALWPAIRDAQSGDRVKLDSTLPRSRFVPQGARIGRKTGGLGWIFDPKTQEWVKP